MPPLPIWLEPKTNKGGQNGDNEESCVVWERHRRSYEMNGSGLNGGNEEEDLSGDVGIRRHSLRSSGGGGGAGWGRAKSVGLVEVG
jgi:hypothetical protein